MVVCPFCLSIFMTEYSEGDECPHCEVDKLVDYDEFQLRINSSFMEYISKERGITDDE